MPYKICKGEFCFYIQKRSDTAKRAPGYFGFWGGGAEDNEEPEATLMREIKEELSVDLKDYTFFSRYEFYGSIKSVFFAEVGDDFENNIIIGEGEYGVWINENDIESDIKIINEDKLIIQNLLCHLNGENMWK